MGIFGIGFRILLVGLAVLVERVGSFLREHPLIRAFLASPPQDLERDVTEEDPFA